MKTTATDLAAIFAEINWTQGTPSAEATIAKYGDVSGDGSIKAADYVAIRKFMLDAITEFAAVTNRK